MQLNVLYFAHVRDRVGCSEERLRCPEGALVRDVVALLCERYPALAPLMPTTRVAVDGEFVGPDVPVPDGAEFVLIPPVAGGSGTPSVDLTEAPLDEARQRALIDLVSDDAHGAVVTFIGIVRDHARGRAVQELEYEAYGPMARSQMARLVAEVEAAFEGVRVGIHHRVGRLGVGDVAVVIAVGSAHRAPAFRAAERLIDRVKEDVPIWKREIGPDGAEWVSDRP